MEKTERQTKHFQKRAEQLRFISCDVRGKEDRATLMAIAKEYEQLAKGSNSEDK